jgi:hypothetical protein
MSLARHGIESWSNANLAILNRNMTILNMSKEDSSSNKQQEHPLDSIKSILATTNFLECHHSLLFELDSNLSSCIIPKTHPQDIHLLFYSHNLYHQSVCTPNLRFEIESILKHIIKKLHVVMSTHLAAKREINPLLYDIENHVIKIEADHTPMLQSYYYFIQHLLKSVNYIEIRDSKNDMLKSLYVACKKDLISSSSSAQNNQDHTHQDVIMMMYSRMIKVFKMIHDKLAKAQTLVDEKIKYIEEHLVKDLNKSISDLMTSSKQHETDMKERGIPSSSSSSRNATPIRTIQEISRYAQKKAQEVKYAHASLCNRISNFNRLCNVSPLYKDGLKISMFMTDYVQTVKILLSTIRSNITHHTWSQKYLDKGQDMSSQSGEVAWREHAGKKEDDDDDDNGHEDPLSRLATTALTDHRSQAKQILLHGLETSPASKVKLGKIEMNVYKHVLPVYPFFRSTTSPAAAAAAEAEMSSTSTTSRRRRPINLTLLSDKLYCFICCVLWDIHMLNHISTIYIPHVENIIYSYRDVLKTNEMLSMSAERIMSLKIDLQESINSNMKILHSLYALMESKDDRELHTMVQNLQKNTESYLNELESACNHRNLFHRQNNQGHNEFLTLDKEDHTSIENMSFTQINKLNELVNSAISGMMTLVVLRDNTDNYQKTNESKESDTEYHKHGEQTKKAEMAIEKDTWFRLIGRSYRLLNLLYHMSYRFFTSNASWPTCNRTSGSSNNNGGGGGDHANNSSSSSMENLPHIICINVISKFKSSTISNGQQQQQHQQPHNEEKYINVVWNNCGDMIILSEDYPLSSAPFLIDYAYDGNWSTNRQLRNKVREMRKIYTYQDPKNASNASLVDVKDSSSIKEILENDKSDGTFTNPYVLNISSVYPLIKNTEFLNPKRQSSKTVCENVKGMAWENMKCVRKCDINQSWDSKTGKCLPARLSS